MNILIADDEPTTRTFVEHLIRKLGHEPISCADGKSAMVLLNSPNPPKIAVLDWLMPGYTAPEICKRVREMNPYFKVYLIILTQLGQSHHIVEGLESGANDYICKPFISAEFRVRVNIGIKLLQQQEALKTISGLLKICAWCQKTLNEFNQWEPLPNFVSRHTYAEFSHGSCPECAAKTNADLTHF